MIDMPEAPDPQQANNAFDLLMHNQQFFGDTKIKFGDNGYMKVGYLGTDSTGYKQHGIAINDGTADTLVFGAFGTGILGMVLVDGNGLRRMHFGKHVGGY